MIRPVPGRDAATGPPGVDPLECQIQGGIQVTRLRMRTGRAGAAALSLTAAFVLGVSAHAGPTSPCTIADANPENCQLPNQMGNGPGGTVGATSDASAVDGAGLTVADNFTFDFGGGGVIFQTDVCFWGSYVDFSGDDPIDCSDLPPVDDFTITYYSRSTDDTNLPDAVIATFASGSGLVVTRTATGDVIPTATAGDLVEFAYVATHPAVLLAGDTCYWISIQNNGNGDCVWLWSTAPAGDELSAQEDGDGTFVPGDESTYDLAFCLGGEIVPDGDICDPPANNDCANAIALALDVAEPFDNTFASTTGSPDAACNFGGEIDCRADVWYSFEAPCDGDYTIETCGSSFDTRVHLYEALCPAGVNLEFACSNDDCAANESITETLQAGFTYFVRIGGVAAAQGTGTVLVTSPGCVDPPANDNCASGTPMNETINNPSPVDTLGATTDGPAEGCGTPENDVWYRYLVGDCTEDLTVTVTSDFNPTITIYGAACPGGPSTAIACGPSPLTFTPTGSSHRIRVGALDGSRGTGMIMVECGGGVEPCPEDLAAPFGCVDADDLLSVINAWGTCPPPCPQDLAPPFGEVDADDLLAVINAWGPCPGGKCTQ